MNYGNQFRAHWQEKWKTTSARARDFTTFDNNRTTHTDARTNSKRPMAVTPSNKHEKFSISRWICFPFFCNFTFIFRFAFSKSHLRCECVCVLFGSDTRYKWFSWIPIWRWRMVGDAPIAHGYALDVLKTEIVCVSVSRRIMRANQCMALGCFLFLIKHKVKMIKWTFAKERETS